MRLVATLVNFFIYYLPIQISEPYIVIINKIVEFYIFSDYLNVIKNTPEQLS